MKKILMKKTLVNCILVALACCVAQPSVAASVGFMRDSILSKISSQDIVLLKTTVRQALDTLADKQSTHWTSSNNVSVHIKPKLTYNNKGVACRRTFFIFTLGERKPEHYRFEICKDKTGAWGVAQTLVQQVTAADWASLQEVLNDALDEPSVGVPVSWFGAQSKVTGVIVVMPRTDKASNEKMPNETAAKSCHDVAISIIDKAGAAMDGNYPFCKTDKGWQRGTL